MTPDERESTAILCERIATEQDPEKFDKLVEELNDLLELKHKRIHPEHKSKSNQNFKNEKKGEVLGTPPRSAMCVGCYINLALENNFHFPRSKQQYSFGARGRQLVLTGQIA